jgi:hypothetical protein
MAPVLSSEGEKVNWINYKTGQKDVFFRMKADSRQASIGIELHHKLASLRQVYFHQFNDFRNLLEAKTGESWTWLSEDIDEHGKVISRIFTTVSDVNILKREHWPELISFFKPRMISLDAFWNEVKYAFETF